MANSTQPLHHLPEDLSKLPGLIHGCLKQCFHPMVLQVEDLSAQHRYHRQAPAGQGHYHVMISRDAIPGSRAITKHRAIYTALETLRNQIHALKITLLD